MLTTATGSELDDHAEALGQRPREPGETDDALRARVRANICPVPRIKRVEEEIRGLTRREARCEEDADHRWVITVPPGDEDVARKVADWWREVGRVVVIIGPTDGGAP